MQFGCGRTDRGVNAQARGLDVRLPILRRVQIANGIPCSVFRIRVLLKHVCLQRHQDSN
jgi:hypothetical protein